MNGSISGSRAHGAHGSVPYSKTAVSRLRFKPFQPIRKVMLHAIRNPVVLAVSVVDDKSVPEAHKGLHGFLYGEGGSEEHDQGRTYTLRTGEDEGTAVMSVPSYLESRDGEKPLGVYCVYDKQRTPQYIGYSRNMVLAVKGHLARVGPERCAHVRAMVFGNKSMSSRGNLERGVENWVQELFGGVVPQGNADPHQRAAWEGVTVEAGAAEGVALASPALLDRQLMSPAELAAYEEKKLKLRKAMGDKSVQPQGADGKPEEEEVDDPATRRLKMMKAMNRGDWSAVINAQTQETLDADAAALAAANGGGSSDLVGTSGGSEASDDIVVSPFQDGGAAAASSASRGGRAEQLLTVEAVQACLEEVRPYLMADGGDVEVVEVKNGVVYLRLQGACTTCPSQSATMKGGIERVIKQTFGEQVRDILQLDKQETGANVERVDMALNMLRGAIHNFGGSVEVVSVEDGVCTIKYNGPPAIGKGVQGAVRDSFSDIREVRLVD